MLKETYVSSSPSEGLMTSKGDDSGTRQLLSDHNHHKSAQVYEDASSFMLYLVNSLPTAHYCIDDVAVHIAELPDAAHVLLKPIPIRLKSVGEGEWMASFDEANIAMTGDTPEEAKELLSYDIIDAMELFHANEESLIPDLKQNLMVLRQYIDISE